MAKAQAAASELADKLIKVRGESDSSVAYKQTGKGKWRPLQSRLKVEILRESLSSILDVTTGDTTKQDFFIKCRILDFGPQAGYDYERLDNKIVYVKVHDFKVGDIVITNAQHLIRYKDPADGKLHLFIKDEASIVAMWTPEQE